jgi:hypothetical protein
VKKSVSGFGKVVMDAGSMIEVVIEGNVLLRFSIGFVSSSLVSLDALPNKVKVAPSIHCKYKIKILIRITYHQVDLFERLISNHY